VKNLPALLTANVLNSPLVLLKKSGKTKQVDEFRLASNNEVPDTPIKLPLPDLPSLSIPLAHTPVLGSQLLTLMLPLNQGLQYFEGSKPVQGPNGFIYPDY
jgi:hypothetical protein